MNNDENSRRNGLLIMRLSLLVGLFFIIATVVAHTEDQKPTPPISDSEQRALIAKVKTTWRAQDGETIEEIIAQVAKVAQFIPRGWDVEQTNDGQKSVVLSWAKHPTDKEDDEYAIAWRTNADGPLTLSPPYAKPLELGWQAFALSLIQSEVDDGDENTNQSFLHDPLNLNFVETPEGKLGDLLKEGKCSLDDPIGVDYTDTWGHTGEKGDFWRLQLSVNCNIPGPQYFVNQGVILFKKEAKEPWRPYSFFAHRIAAYPPGRWFNQPDPKERDFFAAGAMAAEQRGLSQSDAEAIMKTMELRNDGSIIPWD
jgi:hypothetical protein